MGTEWATLWDAVSVPNLRQHVEWFSKVRRDTGGPGEGMTVDYIAGELEKYGVEYRVHEFDAFLSYPVQATLQVLEPEELSLPAITHSFGRSTGPAGLVADLIYLPDADVKRGAGRCVLLDGLLSPVKVLEGTHAGVAALIFANYEWYIHNMIATTIWGTPALSQMERIPGIPVVSINNESGNRLKHLLDRGPVRVKIVTEVNTGWFKSRLPEAVIPGTEEPEKFVLAGGHYCSWHVGITDNATGDACLLELARILHQHKEQLRRSVRIAWWPGHSHGRYSGSTWYADTFWEDLARNCIAYHNIDSPGVRGATQYVARHTTAELEGFAKDAIFQVTGQSKPPVHRPSRAADQSFLAIGVPSISCYPFLPEGHRDRRPWTGGSAMGWWWHTEYDTADKCDLETLANDVKLSLAVIAGLCTARVLPLDFRLAAREFASLISDVAETCAGHLDLSKLISKTEAFEAAVDGLSRVQEKLSQEPERRKVERVNRCLMRLSRIVLPVMYSVGGRFTHDPADLTPLMRATTRTVLPGLSRALGLPGLSGKSEYGFLRTEMVRETNRVGDALDQAVELVQETVAALV